MPDLRALPSRHLPGQHRSEAPNDERPGNTSLGLPLPSVREAGADEANDYATIQPLSAVPRKANSADGTPPWMREREHCAAPQSTSFTRSISHGFSRHHAAGLARRTALQTGHTDLVRRGCHQRQRLPRTGRPASFAIHSGIGRRVTRCSTGRPSNDPGTPSWRTRVGGIRCAASTMRRPRAFIFRGHP